MAVFTYEARATDGKKVDGSLKAADRNAAIDQIKKRTPASPPSATSSAAPPAPRSRPRTSAS